MNLLIYLPPLLVGISLLITLLVIGRLSAHIRRGLTKELKILRFAFITFFLAWLIEFILLSPLTKLPQTSLILQSFGPAWYLQHILYIIAIGFTLRWAWHYISLRPLPQFYLSIIAIGLGSFVIATIVFTTVLFRAAENQALISIEADARTFALALNETTDRTTFVAAAIAGRDSLIQAALDNNSTAAKEALGNPVSDYTIGTAYVINRGGELLASRGSERAVGESFSNDPIAQRVFKGELHGAPLVVQEPETLGLTIRGGSPLVRNGQVVGAVVIDSPLDTAFVDRVGSVTGLDVSIYANTSLVSTTLRDDANRLLPPLTIEDAMLAKVVLENGNVFRGSTTVAAKPYFAAAIPIKDGSATPIGILSAGLPAQQLVNALADSTKTSFVTAFILLVLALPIFFLVARYLAKRSEV